MLKISVIVAVYHAEKCLQKCLESLENQTFKDFEVILVDDGSIDNSGSICDGFALHRPNFRVIHKENGGVGSARQVGLENASGEYVIHVDPDDWIEPNMLEEMYLCAIQNSSDMVICDFMSHYKNTCERICQQPKSLCYSDVMREFFSHLHGSCCNKLIKRNLFDLYKLSFPSKLVVWEDLFVCVNLSLNPIRISYLPRALYHYVRNANENSLVKVVSRKKLDSMRYFIDYFENVQNFDESLLSKRKIEAKRTFFLIKNVKKSEFYNTYPEVNSLFLQGFDGFRKVDSLIRLSLKGGWVVSRLLLWGWMMKSRLGNK